MLWTSASPRQRGRPLTYAPIPDRNILSQNRHLVANSSCSSSGRTNAHTSAKAALGVYDPELGEGGFRRPQRFSAAELTLFVGAPLLWRRSQRTRLTSHSRPLRRPRCRGTPRPSMPGPAPPRSARRRHQYLTQRNLGRACLRRIWRDPVRTNASEGQRVPATASALYRTTVLPSLSTVSGLGGCGSRIC